jgi:hypothetical protein
LKLIIRTRISVLILFLSCATCLYGGPMEDAQRMQQCHDRLLTIGVGKTTEIWVYLRDRETLKGSIDYLNDTEVGIRDSYGDLRPVPLMGVMEFTASNQTTGAKAESAGRFRRATHMWWRRVSHAYFSA